MQKRLLLPLVALAFAAVIAVTVLAYAPGLDGVFVFDSVERVVRNDSLRIKSISPDGLLDAAYAAEAGYPQRGLAYVSLALNYYFSGGRFDPFTFKLTNLVIHILNGFLVLALAGMIIARWRDLKSIGGRVDPSGRVLLLALIATGMWMLHPIQLTSVLYVVQRMTSLAATCVLLGALIYIFARTRLDQGRSHSMTLMYGGVIVCTGVGFLFKQNALLLPALIAVLELFLFDRCRLESSRKRSLALYFGLTLVLPAVAGIAIGISGVALVAGSYDLREFDMLQRVLTQARVLFFYLTLLAVPDIRRFGLYHDDFAASVGLVDPWTTSVAILAWIAVIVVVVARARHRAPWAFAVTWFLVAHAAESTVLPLELVHEHRNYVPSVGIWIALAYYAGEVWDRAPRLRALVPSLLTVWMVVLAVVTYVRADAWRNPAALMESLARHHPTSYRAASGYAFNSIPVDADAAVRFDAFRRAASLTSGAVSPLIEMSKINAALGGHVGDGAHAPSAGNGGFVAKQIADMKLLSLSGYDARLESALDVEIKRRLEQERPRTDNVVALVSLVDCSLAGRRECVVLRERATGWHASALSNERLPADLRAVLELSIAKLYVSVGDRDRAVRHAGLAGKSAGDNLFYRLQEAMLYAALERWLELGEALDEIEARFPVRSITDPAYQDLRSRYDRRQNP